MYSAHIHTCLLVAFQSLVCIHNKVMNVFALLLGSPSYNTGRSQVTSSVLVLSGKKLIKCKSIIKLEWLTIVLRNERKDCQIHSVVLGLGVGGGGGGKHLVKIVCWKS